MGYEILVAYALIEMSRLHAVPNLEIWDPSPLTLQLKSDDSAIVFKEVS